MKTNKPNFTKGPWKVETYHGSFFRICKPDFKIGDEIAYRLEADRKLIEAAPEMYEILDTLRIEILSQGDQGDQANLRLIETVLHKARGES